jgi:hypothetical protein
MITFSLAACGKGGNNEEDARDFADNIVMVVLTREATLKFKEYKSADFVGINVLTIEDVSPEITEAVRQHFAGETVTHPYPDLINFDSYTVILKLTLKENSRQGVLAVCSLIKQRIDVQSAEPEYFYPSATAD